MEVKHIVSYKKHNVTFGFMMRGEVDSLSSIERHVSNLSRLGTSPLVGPNCLDGACLILLPGDGLRGQRLVVGVDLQGMAGAGACDVKATVPEHLSHLF